MHRIIQVAGIRDIEEARMLIEAGVDWLGFPFGLPVHQEDLPRKNAAQIIRGLRKESAAASFVLITYLHHPEEVVALASDLGVDRVQLHGEISIDEVEAIRALRIELYLIKSLVVEEHNFGQLQEIVRTYSPVVDAFITDTHDPLTGADGATGKTHDWRISSELVSLSQRPVILAGGLNPQNVRSAILRVRPFGVDVHTGVEGSNGRKESEKVRTFVAAARAGFEAIAAEEQN